MAALPIEHLDLRPGHLAMVRALLEAYLPEAEVLAFGSRVHGDGHEASDLDLVVRRPGLQPGVSNHGLSARLGHAVSPLQGCDGLSAWRARAFSPG